MIGYSVRGGDLSSVLCAPSTAAQGTGGRTGWFDRGDTRSAASPGNAEGGDFAYGNDKGNYKGNYKGQWTGGEDAAGAADLSRILSSGKEPDPLLCRPLALAPAGLTRSANITAMTRRITIILAVAAAGCVALTVGTVLAVHTMRRDREWAHGGDTLAATVEVHVAAPADYPATVAAFGGPQTTTAVMDEAKQAVVVRVRWSGPAHGDGVYSLLVLDSRMKPARLLPLRGSWSAGGRETYDGWEGAYDALPEHYAWLAGIAYGDSRPTQPDGSTYALRATSIPATARGELDGVYFVNGGRAPFAGTGGVLVALVYQDRSGVRWATRVTG